MRATAPSVKMKDFENSDGDVDWEAYRKARVANGEECRQCSDFIVWPQGSSALCSECKDAVTGTGELSHSSYARCPYCGDLRDMSEGTHYDTFGEGRHDMLCMNEHCEKSFEITTHVSYTFTSPARIVAVEDATE